MLSEAPLPIKVAFYHVRRIFPGVDRVEYDDETRWRYKYPDGTAPSFSRVAVDVGLLEDGQSALGGVPICYIEDATCRQEHCQCPHDNDRRKHYEECGHYPA